MASTGSAALPETDPDTAFMIASMSKAFTAADHGPCEAFVTGASAEGLGAMTIPAALDLYIECEMRERQIPGVALAITRNGEILTERAYGLASIQNNAPVTTGTRFAIASVTKPITAIGIMLLVEEGKVELDAPISRYLPEAPAAWYAMTVRHLLNHTSGLPEIGHGWAEWDNQGREDLLRLSGLHLPTEPLYRIALQDTLWFAPGTDWVYSDVGYFLLGVITERASGISWRDFIHERIFLPLGMTDSYISDGWTIYRDEARGYTIRDGVLSNIRRDRTLETPSHYGIFSNVGDLAKLDAALAADRLLSETSGREMWAPTEHPGGRRISYGLGWEVWHMRGHRAQYHGGITGAEFLRLPDDSLAVIVLTNLGHGTRYGMSQNVAKLFIPELRRPALHEVPISEAELRHYAGRYTALSGDPFEVKFADGRLIAPYPWPFPRQGGEAALIHQGDHVFEFVDHDGRIVFQLAEDGTVAGLSAVAWDGGYQSDFRRTAPLLPPSPQQAVDPSSHVPLSLNFSAVATSIAKNADIQEGELVWIYGGSVDVEFMEKLAVAVAALGGQPLVSLFSDVTMRDWYRDVPERFDTMRDDWRWQIHQNADVLFLLSRIDPATYDGIAAERLGAYGASNSGLWDVVQERGARIVHIGNRVHPSEWSARMFGIEQSELESIYWKGMAADRVRLADLGARFKEILRGASTVRIQHPNGTDITVGVRGQRIVVTDGSFPSMRTEPDPSTGLYQTWLPGGEVTLGVDPESAEGRLVLERFFLDGQDMKPTTLTFSGGRLVALESESELSRLREHTQSALPMSDRLTGLKFGVNPEITDARILPWMGAGMVSPTLGSNLVLGGDIDLAYGPVFLTLAGSTIHVDGRLVVENGVLKL